VIFVDNLTKRFPVKRPLREMLRRPLPHNWAMALDGVNLEINQGEVFGLLGPNGAGKTTFLKILSTLLLPTAGRVAVAGYDVVKAPDKVRKTIGCCLDTERSFYYRLTGRQNLTFFATLNNLNARAASSRVEKVLDIVGLNGAAGTPFMNYSKGMQQKLGLARALLTDPAVLLLDEPTKSLDLGAATEFRRFLRGKAAELRKTVLVVTHSPEEASECDRLAIMDQGRIVAQGSRADVRDFIRAQGLPAYALDDKASRAAESFFGLQSVNDDAGSLQLS
jgi:ABC-2 type transport system ATP-binding protein